MINQNISIGAAFIFSIYLTYYTTFNFIPYKQTTSKMLLSFAQLCFQGFSIRLHGSSLRPQFASLSLPFIVRYFSTPPCRQTHHLFLYEEYRSGSAARPLKGSYFAKRFTACLTLREKDVGITPCAGVWMISPAHPPLYRVLNKRPQDLPLHQMRILTSQGKRPKQWRGIAALHCLYSRSFFLSLDHSHPSGQPIIGGRAFRSKSSG